MPNLFARKPIAILEAEAAEPDAQALTTHDSVPLRRSLTASNLVALGIGAIIGAGIFVLTGHAAAANAGPAIVISFVLGGIACAFAGLCYAEMASAVAIIAHRTNDGARRDTNMRPPSPLERLARPIFPPPAAPQAPLGASTSRRVVSRSLPATSC